MSKYSDYIKREQQLMKTGTIVLRSHIIQQVVIPLRILMEHQPAMK